MSAKTISKTQNRIRMSSGDRAFVIICYLVVLLVAFICFYPFWYVIINSVVTKDAALKGVYIFPKSGDFYFGTYLNVLKRGDIFSGMLVSAARTVISTVGCTVFSAMFAFLMTRPKLRFRKFIYRYAIITMYVSGGLIPWYLMMKFYGLYNNFGTYVVPGMFSAYSVILIKTFMESIPPSLEESARIDGAGFVTTFFKIIMPLCKPILATCALFTAVGTWNLYFDNYLLVQNPHLQTVQMALYNYIKQAEALAANMQQAAQSGVTSQSILKNLQNNLTVESVRNVATILSILPIMLVYPFLQKYFAKGIMLGAIKG